MASHTLFVGQNRALQLLVAGAPLKEVFAALVRALEGDLDGHAVAAILLLDADGQRLRHGAAPSLPDSYNNAIDGIAIGPNIGTCCAAAARNEVVVTVDIENDPNWASFKSLPLDLGLRAAWSMPLRSAQGAVLGTFGTYFRECRAPTHTEREIVGVMAKTAAVAIEHRAMEDALRERESFLQGIIGASADCIKVLNLEGRIQWMSENGLCVMEVGDFKQIENAEWLSFWQDGATREKARAALRAAIEGETGRFSGFCLTLRGTAKWWDVVVTRIPHEAGGTPALLCVSRDITETKNAQQWLEVSEARYRLLASQLEQRVITRTGELAASNRQLRDEIAGRSRAEQARQILLQQLGAAEENERRRISRELHDEVGQSIAALQVGLQALQSGQLDAKTTDALARLESIAGTIGQEIHDIALELRPAALDDLGLRRAIANYVEQWSSRTGVPAVLHQSGDWSRPPIPGLETSIYRIVQEALNNVVKHAKATHVSVVLEFRADHVLTIVEDDGIGFDADSVGVDGTTLHLGLLGMRERASLLGGTVSIESKPGGGGTAVFVRIPLPMPADG